MSYKSDAQRRKFHAMLNRGEIAKSVVDEYDRASKGKKLPGKVRRKQVRSDVAAAVRMN